MTKPNNFAMGVLLMLFSFAGFACSRQDTNPAEVPDPIKDEALVQSPADDAQQAGDASQNQAEKHTEPATKQIVLAGGCFWCVEAVYEQIDGVLDVESGYAGGEAATAKYEYVSTGRTKHAEVVRISYDASQLQLGTILKIFFTTAHDPTTLNRQGADVGPQYRSAIFYANDEQKQIAQAYIKQLDASGKFRSKIVTTLEPLDAYYPAETKHQDFAKRNPTHGYIQGVSTPKVQKTQQYYPDLLKDSE